MTQAQQVLIDLLKKSLFNFELEIPENTDWQAVYDEANFQSVIPIAFDGTARVDCIPADVYKKFKNHTVAVILNNDNVVNGQKELTVLLEKNNIKYAILKGLSVAKCYPKPELRTLGDVDFLVSKEDFLSTKQLLIENGYMLTKEEENHFHCEFKRKDVSFELHFEMSDFPNTEIGGSLRKELEDATENANSAECIGARFSSLDELYQAVSLLLHTERHISKDGIGLRQLIDFGMFVDKNPQFMSKEENVEFLKRNGLYKLATVCVDLFKKYFCGKDIENPTADMLFEMALKKGNFGSKRSQEETYASINPNVSDKNTLVKYYKYFEKRATLTWSLAKKYPFLRHFAIIYLPIRHVFRILFKKGNRINFKEVLSSYNEVDSLYNELNVFKE